VAKVHSYSDGEFVYLPPSGPRGHVVLLPGLVVGSWMWSPTIRALSERGYGSLALTNAFAADHRTADGAQHAVIELMQRCGIRRAVIAGGSFGSRVALECAADYPEIVELVVVSGAPVAAAANRLGLVNHGKLTLEYAFQLADQLFYDRRCISDAAIRQAHETFARPQQLLNLVSLLRECRRYDFAAPLARIEALVLMVWGSHDRISSCDEWARIAPLARRNAFHRIEACGHTPMIEKPDAFNALLLDYLEREAHHPREEPLDRQTQRFAHHA
jgi:2-hydroxy-6-oxonona-2,4-dienedioate hydrolase